MLDFPYSVPLYGNKCVLHSIVINLVDNGLCHISEGGCVQVEIERDSDVVTLGIRDDSRSILDADSERILDRYFRVAGNSVSPWG